MCFLFQNVLSFKAKNIPENSYYPLLKSIIKVFSFFIVQFEFSKYEATKVLIQCNNFSKSENFELYETVTIDILIVFIKDIVFHNVGLSWMILTKDQYEFDVEENCIEWCT